MRVGDKLLLVKLLPNAIEAEKARENNYDNLVFNMVYKLCRSI